MNSIESPYYDSNKKYENKDKQMHATQTILLLTQIWCQNTNTMIHNSCAVLTKYKIQSSKKYKHSHHVTQTILLLTWPFAQIQPDPMPLFFFIRSADNALSQTSTSALTWTKKFQRKTSNFPLKSLQYPIRIWSQQHLYQHRWCFHILGPGVLGKSWSTL